MLSELNHPFKIIGLTETWHSNLKENMTNSSLSGFNYISQPTKFSVGVVGLFLANS